MALFTSWASLSLHIMVLIAICECQLNQYTEYTDSDGSFVWESLSAFSPMESQSFGSITIGHVVKMEFDFVWNGYTTSSQNTEMFFRIGADADAGGTGCGGNLNQYPSLWITYNNNPYLLLSLSQKAQCNRNFDLSPLGAITEGVDYHVIIAFNQSLLSVTLNDTIYHWTRNGTDSEYIGTVVPVWWMSNKFGSTSYNRANGTFSNILIRSTVLSTTSSTSNPTTTSTPNSNWSAPTVDATDSVIPTASPTTTPDGGDSHTMTTMATTAHIVDDESTDSGPRSSWILVVIPVFALLCLSTATVAFCVILKRKKERSTHCKVHSHLSIAVGDQSPDSLYDGTSDIAVHGGDRDGHMKVAGSSGSGHSAVHSVASHASTAGGPMDDVVDAADIGPSSFVVEEEEEGADDEAVGRHRETAGREDSFHRDDDALIEHAVNGNDDDDEEEEEEDMEDEDVLADINEYTIGGPSLSMASPQEEGFLKGRFGRDNLKLRDGEDSHGFNGTLYDRKSMI